MNQIEDIFESVDPEALLLKLNTEGKIPSDVFAHVVDILEQINIEDVDSGLPLDDLYAMLLIVGKVRDFKYQYLFNKYLELKDPFIVSMVLETVCLNWKLTEEYLEYIINFAVGAVWDSEDDVCVTSVKILGEYLHSEQSKPQKTSSDNDWNKKVTELLLNILSDAGREHWVRQGAYCSLLRAFGKDWSELPGECAVLDLHPGSPDVDWEAVKTVAKMYLVAGSSVNQN